MLFYSEYLVVGVVVTFCCFFIICLYRDRNGVLQLPAVSAVPNGTRVWEGVGDVVSI